MALDEVLELLPVCCGCRVPPKYSHYERGSYREEAYKGYAQLFSEKDAQVVAVTADKAAAHLTGYGIGMKEWPPCTSLGRCEHGMCALQWKHPACCYHNPYRRDRDQEDYDDSGSEDSYGDAKASTGPARAQKPAATISSAYGHWESRTFYCWGHGTE